MKKPYLLLAAILFAIALFSCNKSELATNSEIDEGNISNTKGSNITVDANPAIVFRRPETINNTSVETFWVMDANGSNQTRLYNPNITSGRKKKIYTFFGPHWSADGNGLCFSQDNSLYKLTVTLSNGVPTATNVTKLLDATTNNSIYYDSYWSFGTTNEIIYIVKNKTDNLYRIQAIPGGGGTPSTIYTGSAGDILRWITVSPDGSQIAFTKIQSGSKYVIVINRNDGTVAYSIQTNSILNGLFEMDWARTAGSTTLAIYATPPGSSTATVYTMDFTDVSSLTSIKSGARAPSWSPDDSKLVYTEVTNPNYINTYQFSDGTTTTLGSLFGYTVHWKK